MKKASREAQRMEAAFAAVSDKCLPHCLPRTALRLGLLCSTGCFAACPRGRGAAARTP